MTPIPGVYVAAECAACGCELRLPAVTVPYTSVLRTREVERYYSGLLCPRCQADAETARSREAYLHEKEARHAARKARRRSAADIIREHNLKHAHHKKRTT